MWKSLISESKIKPDQSDHIGLNFLIRESNSLMTLFTGILVTQVRVGCKSLQFSFNGSFLLTLAYFSIVSIKQ